MTDIPEIFKGFYPFPVLMYAFHYIPIVKPCHAWILLDIAELCHKLHFFRKWVPGNLYLLQIKFFRNGIYIKEFNTSVKKIAFNSKKSDGFNPQLVVNDEMEAWPGDDNPENSRNNGLLP